MIRAVANAESCRTTAQERRGLLSQHVQYRAGRRPPPFAQCGGVGQQLFHTSEIIDLFTDARGVRQGQGPHLAAAPPGRREPEHGADIIEREAEFAAAPDETQTFNVLITIDTATTGAFVGWLDIVLLPLLILFILITGYALWKRRTAKSN